MLCKKQRQQAQIGVLHCLKCLVDDGFPQGNKKSDICKFILVDFNRECYAYFSVIANAKGQDLILFCDGVEEGLQRLRTNPKRNSVSWAKWSYLTDGSYLVGRHDGKDVPPEI